LLVNCSLKGTVSKDLFNAVTKFSECKAVNFSEISENYQISGDINAIVISGSAARIVDPKDQAKFKGLACLIRICELPVLGICFGHQLLCSAFGAKTGSLGKPVIDRFEEVHVLSAEGILSGFTKEQTVPLAEYHNDYVLKDSLGNAGFTLLADSVSCEVEAVKHNSKPFFGVQFHPERLTIGNETHPEGQQIIENFYTEVKHLSI
jgi:GMP synthase-like glutamine amidotransferase